MSVLRILPYRFEEDTWPYRDDEAIALELQKQVMGENGGYCLAIFCIIAAIILGGIIANRRKKQQA